jgi:multidrug efflux system membrane fusion protein
MPIAERRPPEGNAMQTPPRGFTRKTIAIALGLLVLAGAAGVSLTSQASRPSGPPPGPAPVTVAAAVERTVTEWDEFSGRIQAVEHVEIRPRVAGTIDAIHFHEGQLVRAGDPLFTLDPRPYEADRARAQAALAGALARRDLALTELARARRLIDEHAIAQREFDQSEDALHEAQANVAAQQAALQSAELNLQYTAIRSPVTGRISRAEITLGNLVGSGPTAPVLTTVVSVSPVYLSFDMDEQTYQRYAAQGFAGNSGVARITVAAGLSGEDGYPHSGHIQSIDNQMDTASGTIRVRAVLDNAKGALTPGEFARVRIGGTPDARRVLIDDRAVGTDQDKKFVMVVDADNRAAYRNITLGPMVDGLRIVRSGLQKDERIVVSGLQRVRPNDVVAPTVARMGSSAPEQRPLVADRN